MLLAAVLLVSAAAISYEILLVRLLSIVQWHHFAWMVISLALLGYGASGTAIALVRAWLQPRFEQAFALSAFLFSVTTVACFVLGQQIPFNALEVAWNPRQFLYLGLMYLVFMVPFFFAASCIGLAFTFRRDAVERIYLFDLVGAGLGAVLLIALLFLLMPQLALIVLAVLSLGASVLISSGQQRRGLPARAVLPLLQWLWLLTLVFLSTPERIDLRVSEFKGLSQALEVMDSRVLERSSSPLGLLTVVESPSVPFRQAPGLSFVADSLPPDQIAVFTDGDAISAMNRWNPESGYPEFLTDVTAALPYRLLHQPRVLVLGAGAGFDVLLALTNGARKVDAVELNPQLVGLLRGKFAEYSGNLYEHERVSVHVSEARGFVARIEQEYDLIQLSLLDSFGASGSGTQTLNESHLYTIEAMRLYLSRLEPGGILAITRWLKVPPRDSLKLAATVIEAMRLEGVADPGTRMVMIRSWNTFTLLARNGEFTAAELEAVRQFSSTRFFDTAYHPSMSAEEANRFNRLDQPWIFEGIKKLLGPERERFTSSYKFQISPATDDRPYFFHFLKWRVLPEVLELRERGGAGLIEWSYLVLLATLGQAVLAGLLLILLPLALAQRGASSGQTRLMGSYFFALGMAFLFIEMAFIQKFVLFLSHPLYAVAVVLAGFLVFAGLGSGYSARLGRAGPGSGVPPVTLAVAGISIFALAYLLLLPWVFDRFAGHADWARITIALALIAPLAFCMGMPFPLGLRRLAETAPTFIPWAWGINGFASVISAALATLLALHFGFTVVLLSAVTLYVLAAVLMDRSDRAG